MSKQALNQYAQRMDRVCHFIQTHLGDVLSLDRLSEVACFSKFHFHRQFSAYMGITVGKYILLSRLKRASQQLAFEKTRIIEIAFEANFESPESFSRAFKNTFGQTPSAFRKHPNWDNWYCQYAHPIIEGKETMHVTIEQFQETQVAAIEHLGPITTFDATLETFRAWRKSTPYSPIATHRTFGLVYNDPETTEPAEFRFDLCAEVTEAIPKNPQGLVNKTIPGERYAVLRHEGDIAKIGEKVRYLYCNWLPSSGEELRDAHCFFHYTNVTEDLPGDQWITDIYLPLKS